MAHMERAVLLVRESEPAGLRHSPEEEATLIGNITAGDKGRFLDLVQPHLVSLWRTVRTRIKNDEDAQDVVQETLLKAFKHLAQFHFASSFRTWLCSIAMNEACQMRRDAAGWIVTDINDLEFERIPMTGRQESIEARLESGPRVRLHRERQDQFRNQDLPSEHDTWVALLSVGRGKWKTACFQRERRAVAESPKRHRATASGVCSVTIAARVEV